MIQSNHPIHSLILFLFFSIVVVVVVVLRYHRVRIILDDTTTIESPSWVHGVGIGNFKSMGRVMMDIE